MNRQILLSVLMLLMPCVFIAQVSYRTKIEKPLPLLRSVNLEHQPQADAFVQYLNYPKPGGDAYHVFLQEQKEKSRALFPERATEVPAVRSLVNPPVLLNSFSGNSFTAGIPLDNHLAVNRTDQIVTVVNVQLLVVGPTGVWDESYSLDDFWSELGESEFYFDPRVIYDPVEDRYILVMMQDSDCDGSNIVFAFSATNDPTGEWHLYQFSGCPNVDATFADYPMISLTEDELFFSYNAVYQDSSWQTGFGQTLIYQINKHDGYAGNELQWRSWQDIELNGRKIRYMCPVKYPTEDMPAETYFLSTRSFDIQNDTVFLVRINGNMSHPGLGLDIRVMKANQPYGVPPNARQPKDFLQTNDARVLDAFIYEDQIQFVGNTMDPLTGRSGVYHGIVQNASGAPVLHTEILRNGSDHFAYPGISHTGSLPGEHDAIIIASHASPTRFPGYSALYYHNGYSEWIPVKEGLRNIDMLKKDNPFGLDPTLERWGDYSGIQRQYEDPGTIWTASSYGKPGNVNDTWVGHLSRPEEPSATGDTERPEGALTAFPNPAVSVSAITFEAEVNAQGKVLEANLYDLNGQLIKSVFKRELTQEGPFRFYFNQTSLEPGTYVLNVTIDGTSWKTEKIVVQ